MQKLKIAVFALTVALLAISAAGQTFKVYPGAKKLEKESAEIAKTLPAGSEGSVYVTNDSYEKVVAFYKGIGKEYTMPYMKKTTKLPTGQELMSVYFIFDGAASIATSKNWAKVQRPYVGSVKMNGMTPEYSDIRDVTAIVTTTKK